MFRPLDLTVSFVQAIVAWLFAYPLARSQMVTDDGKVGLAGDAVQVAPKMFSPAAALSLVLCLSQIIYFWISSLDFFFRTSPHILSEHRLPHESTQPVPGKSSYFHGTGLVILQYTTT
jgi:hypothetical protein